MPKQIKDKLSKTGLPNRWTKSEHLRVARVFTLLVAIDQRQRKEKSNDIFKRANKNK